MNMASNNRNSSTESDYTFDQEENEASYHVKKRLFPNSNQEKSSKNKMYKFKKLVNKWSIISIKEDRIEPLDRRNLDVIINKFSF
jgi:hypothetical protein